MTTAEVRLLPHQRALVQDRTSPILVLKGGLRAGKTVGAVWKAVTMASSSTKPILVCEPTYQMLRDVFVETARKVLNEAGIPYEWQRTDHILTVWPSSPHPLRLFCRSMDRPERIIGFTAGGAVVDEWESCTEEGIMRVRERITPTVGDVNVPQLVLVGTPEGFGFGYRWTEENPLPGLRLITARTVDNVTVDRSYVDGVRAILSEGEARERLEGIRTPKSGAVYSRFSRERHCAIKAVDDNEGTIEIAADFNVATMAWIFLRVSEDRRRFHVVGELVGRETDTIEQSQRALEWLADYFSRTTRQPHSVDDVRRMQVRATIDASGSSRSSVVPLSHVAVMRQAGLRPQYPTANPRVEDRVTAVQVACVEDRLSVDAKAAPYLVRCLEGQPYDDSGRPSKDPRLALDHACFVGGTQITLADGMSAAIEDITPGMLVLTRAGPRRVTQAGMTSPSAPVLSLRLANGQTLTGTGAHPVWVDGKGFARLDSIGYGDMLLAEAVGRTRGSSAPVRAKPGTDIGLGSTTCNGNVQSAGSPSPSTSTGRPHIAHVPVAAFGAPVCVGNASVYNLAVDGENEYFASGVLVHNCDALGYAVHWHSPAWRAAPNAPLVDRGARKGTRPSPYFVPNRA